MTAGLMLVEAVTLAVASIIHFGVVISLGVVTLNDPFAGARFPEAILALAVAAGATSLLTPWAGAWRLALATTLLTIVGVLVGVRFVLVGPISRPGDLLYHASLLIALLVTVPPLLRLRTRGGLTRRAG
ncbi:MAG TPA: hypothetical protein VIU62_24370 [Chloroflexota bacterium]